MKNLANHTIGLIGFGEVGEIFGAEMAACGAHVAAYDVLMDDPHRGETLQARADAAGVELDSLDAVAKADFILSLVTTQVAVKVAQRCVPHLEAGSIYIDLNSSSPAIKREIQTIIEESGCGFVEGAILGAVGATGTDTRTLLAGKQAENVAKSLNDFGLNMDPYSSEVGKASAFKMIRSVFSKGFEAILIEMLIAGFEAGVAQDLWDDATSFMEKKPFSAIANNWITSHAVAHERRFHEMCQVSETLRELDLEPVMTASTTALFDRSGDLNLGAQFQEKPDSWQAVIAHMATQLKAQEEQVLN